MPQKSHPVLCTTLLLSLLCLGPRLTAAQQLSTDVSPRAGIRQYERQKHGAHGTGGTSAITDHRLAVFIPLVSSDHGVERLVQSLQVCLAANPSPFDIFLLAQADKYLPNLGALLNAGAKLLNGTVYDHYSWLTERFVCPAYPDKAFSLPTGALPGLIPPGLSGQTAHTLTERIGTLVFSREQFQAVDGFLSEAWNGDWHTRIGPNMVRRLKAQDRWPVESQPKHQEGRCLVKAPMFPEESRPANCEPILRAPGAPMCCVKAPPVDKDRERAAAAASLGRRRGLQSTDFTLDSLQAVQNVVRFSVRLRCPPSEQSSCAPKPEKRRRRSQSLQIAAGWASKKIGLRDEGPRPHKLAVIIPYRGRPAQLEQMLPVTNWCISRSGIDHQIFLVEQSDKNKFNRGALLNAGVLLLEGSEYDFFAFHDADVMCGSHPVSYTYPSGMYPLHLTASGLQPQESLYQATPVAPDIARDSLWVHLDHSSMSNRRTGPPTAIQTDASTGLLQTKSLHAGEQDAGLNMNAAD
ncbi:hypothetical protein WJX84_008363 [Apatococcus fuscideae]|uniref:Galactosyltransferase N-terminal domain-containing protein n=1 Tax=Apatococcus fuscideae TaxID=2026836 RepID=A0AAW1TD85_9CHLO